MTCPFTTSTTNEAGCHHIRLGDGRRVGRSDVVGGKRNQMVRGHCVEVVVVAEVVVEVVGVVVVVEATMVVPGTHAH